MAAVTTFTYPPTPAAAAPVGGATAANQATEIASLASIDSKTPALVGGSVPVTGSITATNPSVGSTGSAAPSSATLVGGSDGTNIRGIKVSAAGVVSVDGSAATQPVSGTVTANAGTGTFTVDASGHTVPVSGTFWQAAQPVSGTFWQATQPVSAGSLPLPTGASTAANQASELTLVGAVTETAPASDTASSGLNGRLQRIAQRLTSMIAQLPAALGQTTKSGSISVTIASDQGSLPTVLGGRTSANAPTFLDYSSTNITTSAYVTVVGSTANALTKMNIFSSTGESLYLATGAAASEVNQIIIPPGGQGDVELSIASGTRISVKVASSNTVSVGVLNITYLS